MIEADSGRGEWGLLCTQVTCVQILDLPVRSMIWSSSFPIQKMRKTETCVRVEDEVLPVVSVVTLRTTSLTWRPPVMTQRGPPESKPQEDAAARDRVAKLDRYRPHGQTHLS